MQAFSAWREKIEPKVGKAVAEVARAAMARAEKRMLAVVRTGESADEC